MRKGDADGIVATCLDRLSRSVEDVLALAKDAKRRQWRLATIDESLDTSTPSGRLALTILAALAEFERDQTAERVTTALAQVAREGRLRSGTAPLGYMLPDGRLTSERGERAHLVENPEEQPVLRRIVQLRRKGLGARRVAHALNGAGIAHPRTGREWTPGATQKALATISSREKLGLKSAALRVS